MKCLVLLVLLAAACFGQGPTTVQQSQTRLDAATIVGTSVTSAATITITVAGGQFFEGARGGVFHQLRRFTCGAVDDFISQRRGVAAPRAAD